MNRRLRTTTSLALSFALIFNIAFPIFVAAQSQSSGSGQAQPVGVDANGNPVYQGKLVNQASVYRQGIESGQTSDTSSGYADAIGSAVGCSAGQILSSMIVSSVTSMFQSQAQQQAQQQAQSSASSQTSVPVAETDQSKLSQNTENIKKDSNLQRDAEYGSLGMGGILSGSSWNSIAWCLINAIIEWIADKTIEWANNGFNGNPAFIDNPEQFFNDLADQEAAAFIQGIVKNTTGINVCQPFRVQIAVNLSRSYGGQRQIQSQCTIDTILSNAGYNSFVSGDFNAGGWDGWLALTQNDANNVYGSYIMNNRLMSAAIQRQNNTATLQLNWNKGFLSYEKCADKKDKSTCKITTPGTLIQSSLEDTLKIPKDRLVLAQKFDQVVSAVVNNLIKIALNKVLEESQGDDN